MDDEAILAEVNRYLHQAFDEAGVDRWWNQPRLQLANRTPQDIWDTSPKSRPGILRLVRALYRDSPRIIPASNLWKRAPR